MKITFAASKSAISVSLVSGDETSVFVGANGQKTLHIGVGKPKEMTWRKFILVCRQVVVLAKAHKIKKIAINFADFRLPSLKKTDEEIAQTMATSFEMANFEFLKYKTPPEKGWDFVDEVVVRGVNPVRDSSLSGASRRAFSNGVKQKVKKSFNRGLLIGQEVNACRMLSNTPGGHMTPRHLAESTKSAARGTKAKVTVLDKKQIQKLKMGGVLGVAQGSSEEPKFIIVEYHGGGGSEKPIVLVGKGVTFDTGGLNLKPTEAIYEMHLDMSGGAAVIHAVILAAKLKLKRNVVALVPAVENMPSGSSYRPGDVLRTMSGKTIEVLNTDAEGRVILSDALTYAARYKPELVVDVATLTGASMVALGTRASAIFTKDEKLEHTFRQLGEESGDYVWPLPLWDEYFDDIKGTFADVANAGKTRYGGAITGALFLYQFASGYPWVHMDIAPRMTTIEGEYLAKGAAGAPVQLLIRLLETYGRKPL